MTLHRESPHDNGSGASSEPNHHTDPADGAGRASETRPRGPRPVPLQLIDALLAKAEAEGTTGRKTHGSNGHAPAHLVDGNLSARIDAYLASLPGAVSGTFIDGMRGHDRTIYTAGKLIRGFALTPEAAFPHFARWNQKCEPPWSEKDLWHKLTDADKRPGPRGFLLNRKAPAAGGQTSSDSNTAFRNFKWDEVTDGETTRRVKKGHRGPDLLEQLVAFTGGWPRRVGPSLFAPDSRGNLQWFESASQLFAWIESQYSSGGKGVEWVAGPDCVSQQLFFDLCCQEAEDFDQVELYPHEPLLPRTFYHHPDPTGGDGKLLDELVRRFSPATDLDGDLIRGYFLSLFWGGKPGQRPGWLFTVQDDDPKGGRGIGKTTIAVAGANLVGGFISCRSRENFDTLLQRLLSPGSAGKRVLLLDNLKKDRYSNQDLESLITSPSISGKRMYKGEGQRPNYLTVVVTVNDPGMSEDIAQRAIVVRLSRPAYNPEWLEQLEAFVEQNRWGIIGDCLAELRSEGQPFLTTSRWGEWQRAVLSKLPDPDAIQREINSRERECNSDADEREWVKTAVADWLVKEKYTPATARILIEVKVLAHIISEAGGEPMTPSGTGAYLKRNHPSCLVRSNRQGVRYWLWIGEDADPKSEPVPIDTLPVKASKAEPAKADNPDSADDADEDEQPEPYWNR